MSGKDLCERIREGGSTAQKAYLWTPSIIFKYFSSDILFKRVSLRRKDIFDLCYSQQKIKFCAILLNIFFCR